MAQINYALYKDVAVAYAQIWEYIDGVDAQARTALDRIVDVTSTGYTDDDGTGAASSDNALAVELALLSIYNNAYISSTASTTASYLGAVRAINNYVISNYVGSEATPTGKLTEFVNTTMQSTWVSETGGCVPNGWAELSNDAGYTTTDWNTCS